MTMGSGVFRCRTKFVSVALRQEIQNFEKQIRLSPQSVDSRDALSKSVLIRVQFNSKQSINQS